MSMKKIALSAAPRAEEIKNSSRDEVRRLDSVVTSLESRTADAHEAKP